MHRPALNEGRSSLARKGLVLHSPVHPRAPARAGSALSALVNPGACQESQHTPPPSLISLEPRREDGQAPPGQQLGAQRLSPAARSPTALTEMRSTWEGCGRGEGALGCRLAPPRSLPQHSQGGESQISCIPGHEMPCEVGRPRARPLLNPEGARVVWVGRTGRGCRPNGSVGSVCLCEAAESSRLRS